MGASCCAGPGWKGLEEHFESQVLPLFVRRSHGVSKLILWLYLYGLALGDFDLAYVKAGLEKPKTGLRVVSGGLRDGRKLVLTVEPGYRESTESWSEVLRGFKGCGLNCPCRVAGEGNLGIWSALANIYPEALEPPGWNHTVVKLRDKLPQKLQT